MSQTSLERRKYVCGLQNVWLNIICVCDRQEIKLIIFFINSLIFVISCTAAINPCKTVICLSVKIVLNLPHMIYILLKQTTLVSSVQNISGLNIFLVNNEFAKMIHKDLFTEEVNFCVESKVKNILDWC